MFQKFKSNYLDVENSPLYPFGYGLSYSHFTYSGFLLDKAEITELQSLTVRVTVTNDGEYDGEEIVQMYVRDLVASVTRPVKELVGFRKILLKAGEKKTISFEINSHDLAFYRSDMSFVAEPGEYEVFVGDNSCDVLEAKFKLVEKK